MNKRKIKIYLIFVFTFQVFNLCTCVQNFYFTLKTFETVQFGNKQTDTIKSCHSIKLKTHRGLAKNVMHCLESGLYHFVLDYRLPDTSAAFFLINKY